MASLSDLIRFQLAYEKWAAARVLDAAARLTSEELTYDFKSSEKSILGTLVHCYRADRIWFKRMQGEMAAFASEGDDTLTALQLNWPAIIDQWIAWAGDLTDEGANAELSYKDLKGRPFANSIWTIVSHLVNHSTHHRGQVLGFLRALGHTPPNLDFIGYARELSRVAPQNI